jgi:hypothetical protein
MAFFLAMFYCCKCDMEMFVEKKLKKEIRWNWHVQSIF